MTIQQVLCTMDTLLLQPNLVAKFAVPKITFMYLSVSIPRAEVQATAGKLERTKGHHKKHVAELTRKLRQTQENSSACDRGRAA